LTLIECGSAVDTHWEVIVAGAGFVSSGIVVGGHIPIAPQKIINMLTVPSSISSDTSSKAEFGIGDERSPFVVLEVCAEGISVDEAADRIPIPISPMRIQLTPRIPLRNINLRKIAHTSNLHIIHRLHEMNTLQRPIRHRPRSPPTLRTPRNFLTFRISDSPNGRRSPETEVVDVVYPCCLAGG